MRTEQIGDPDPVDLDLLYDDSSASGRICKKCGALVGNVGDYPKRHVEWHRTNGR